MVSIDFSKESFSVVLARCHTFLNNEKLPEWERDIWTFIQSFLDTNTNTFSIFTSGSTGKPKLIKHSRAQLLSSAKATIELFELQQGNHILLALPVKHIGGRMMIVRASIAGLKLSYIPVSSNPLNGITINDKFDFAAFTPMQFANVLNDAATRKKAENISKVILGGGEVSNILESKIELLNIAVFHTYGMTETASHVAVKKLNGNDASDCFTALPGISFTIDERKCLVIDAPLFSEAVFITNDIVRLNSPNSFIWVGRVDNIINTGGIKIHAEDIERKLYKALPCRFFFTANKDAVLGERIVLVLESALFDEKQMKQLIKVLNKHLGKYEMPKELSFVYKFRESESGKTLRAESIKLESKRVKL